tara:strand:- start:1050 stop:1184 length:135 start_codon:yes stop_codon:yes gene_type:complete
MNRLKNIFKLIKTGVLWFIEETEPASEKPTVVKKKATRKKKSTK